MRYLDTGARDPEQSLGAWLKSNLIDEDSVSAVRWQTGFFGADVLGYFMPVFDRLQAEDGHTRLLVGSNDGTTPRADVSVLLSLVGPARHSMRIGVVRFAGGYFHPKTLHFARSDGSQAAYVGSGNLTGSGVAGHVEAGMVVDTRDGDPSSVLDEIAAAADAWFDESRPGLHVVASEDDLDVLVDARILGVPRPPRTRRSSIVPVIPTDTATKLVRLVEIPGLPPELAATLRTPVVISPEVEAGEAPDTATTAVLPGPGPVPVVIEESWSKILSASDAQRKESGNQRGSVTLVKGESDIENAQTYFRDDLFAEVHWVPERTRTGKELEVALVPFGATVRGVALGRVDLRVSYEPSRDQGPRRNYTSLLHLDSLSEVFHDSDMTGHRLTIDRASDGSFTLRID